MLHPTVAVAAYLVPAYAMYVGLRHISVGNDDLAFFDKEDAILALKWPLLAALAVYLMTIGRNAGEA